VFLNSIINTILVNKNSEEVKGNLLNEILNRDFGEHPADKYVNSDDLRFFDQ
jgi:hypothetical protein